MSRGSEEARRLREHGTLTQRLSSLRDTRSCGRPECWLLPGTAARRCGWGTYMAGDLLTHRQAGKSRVLSYLHASPAPASRPPVVEGHVAAPRAAQRAADAERRHQLHRHRPQPAAGKAEMSASCLPASGP